MSIFRVDGEKATSPSRRGNSGVRPEIPEGLKKGLSMLELAFRSLREQDYSLAAAVELVTEAQRQATRSNRQVVDFLISSLGTQISHTRDESYFAAALSFLCAQVLAHAKLHKEAAEAVAASRIKPFSGGDLLFHEADAQSLILESAQEEAISRGVPAIVLASMPRAASAALAHTLARVMRAPIFRVSLGRFPHYGLVPVWLQRFLRGGGVLHDHFGASQFNLQMLRLSGVEFVYVLIRDPRAAAASYARFDKEVDLQTAYSQLYIPWLRGWIDAERSGAIRVKWIRSDRVTSSPEDLRAVLRMILGGATRSLAEPLDQAELAIVNFAVGDPEGWRRVASPKLQGQMWELLPGEVIERLELHR